MKIRIINQLWATASAAHGVLRMVVELKGEVFKIVILIWFIACGTEKLLEFKNFLQSTLF